MEIGFLTSPEEFQQYDRWLHTHPDANLWQSLNWKRFQEALGRTVRIYVVMDSSHILASALVVIDTTRFGLNTWEIPRGPLTATAGSLRVTGDLLQKITGDARDDGCMSVFFSPHKLFPVADPSLVSRHSRRFVMPESTRILDLTLGDDDLLAQMKPKGRYNIHLAEKHAVRVEHSADVDSFAALARQTTRRDGFRSSGQRTYLRFLECLNQSFLLLAYPSETAKNPISGLLGMIWGTHGLYYYGASSNEHRELMAPYLLQWKAIQHCRKHGCTSYDLFGIAPEGKTDHPWSSVSEFKAKFGGSVINYPPEQEIVLRPAVKTLLGWKRKILG